jgi:hypothetical protein
VVGEERDPDKEDDKMHDKCGANAPLEDNDKDNVKGEGKGGDSKSLIMTKNSYNAERHIIHPPAKRAKRNKPVLPGYVCHACQNRAPPSDVDAGPPTPHWIYDCPLKKTQQGSNIIVKKLCSLHDLPSRKVFVGGLPFDCNKGVVKRFFDDRLLKTLTYGDGVVHVKLLKFEDSKHCKG